MSLSMESQDIPTFAHHLRNPISKVMTQVSSLNSGHPDEQMGREALKNLTNQPVESLIVTNPVKTSMIQSNHAENILIQNMGNQPVKDMLKNLSNQGRLHNQDLVVKRPTMVKEHRRSNKPIMEKKRRARINSNLNQLKFLILEALNKDTTKHSKLEKADILEMTVKFLRNMKRKEVIAEPIVDNEKAAKFSAGFKECAKEVIRYLQSSTDIDSSTKVKLLTQVNNSVKNVSQLADEKETLHTLDTDEGSDILDVAMEESSSDKPSAISDDAEIETERLKQTSSPKKDEMITPPNMQSQFALPPIQQILLPSARNVFQTPGNTFHTLAPNVFQMPSNAYPVTNQQLTTTQNPMTVVMSGSHQGGICAPSAQNGGIFYAIKQPTLLNNPGPVFINSDYGFIIRHDPEGLMWRPW